MKNKDLFNREGLIKKCKNEIDVADLILTLGRKFVKSGWEIGHEGSGIVAITDYDEEKFEDAKKIIEDFLKNLNLPTKSKKGYFTSVLTYNYCGKMLGVVTTKDVIKITVSA